VLPTAGFDISEATQYLPKDLPLVGDVTMGVRDLVLGFAPDNGIQLEAFVQLGQPGQLDPGDGGQAPESRRSHPTRKRPQVS